MIRVNYRTLKSRRQLLPIDRKKVVSAGFEDEACERFCVTFDTGNGSYRDLTVFFETRSPHVFISDAYRMEEEKRTIHKSGKTKGNNE